MYEWYAVRNGCEVCRNRCVGHDLAGESHDGDGIAKALDLPLGRTLISARPERTRIRAETQTCCRLQGNRQHRVLPAGGYRSGWSLVVFNRVEAQNLHLQSLEPRMC